MIQLQGHSHIYSMAFSSVAPLLVVSDFTGRVRLWNLNTQTGLDFLPPKEGEGYYGSALAFSPDGNYLVTAPTYSDDLRIWDIQTHRVITSTTLRDIVTCAAWSPKDEIIACGTDSIILIDSRNGAEIETLKGFPDYLSSVCWSSDGKYLAGGTNQDNPTVMIWNMENRSLHASLPTTLPLGFDVTSIAFQNNEKLIFCQQYGIAYEWNIAEQTVISPFNALSERREDVVSQGHCSIISPDGKYLVYEQTVGIETQIQNEDGTTTLNFEPADVNGINLIDLKNNKICSVFNAHAEMITTMAFDPASRFLATGDIMGELYVWNLSELTPFDKR